MKTNPQISRLAAIRLIGISDSMDLSDYRISALWQRFMPRRHEINHTLSEDLYSVALYPCEYFSQFQMDRPFTRWAALSVDNDTEPPEGMQELVIPSGLYAIFHHQGSSSDNAIFDYIYNTWLPTSGYELDYRPHFERLGAQYKQGHPDSEEDIYIPIKGR